MEWIKFDHDNPPEAGRYLVTDGIDIDVLDFCDPFGRLEWDELEKMVPNTPVSFVSHYMKITLPV